jgi:alpha/beta superfamily hydrolase
MAQAPVKQSLVIDGPEGVLEALLESPGAEVGSRIAILCHPHPEYQGTMHNKVVHTLARSMNDLGWSALRFNFRGVGNSEGAYGHGEGEMSDLIAVADYARLRWSGITIWLAGFSFGAVVAARVAMVIKPERLISIAPAVNVLGPELQSVPTMPWLIVQGDADEIVPVADVRSWVKQLEIQPELKIMSGVGHFFHGHLVDLRALLVKQLRE